MSYSFCQLCREQYPSNEMVNGFCRDCASTPEEQLANDTDTCGCQYGEGPCGAHKNRRVCHTCFETYTMIPYFSYETECDPCARKTIADFVGGE